MIVYREAGLEDIDILMKMRLEALEDVFSFRPPFQHEPMEKATRAYYAKHLEDRSHVALLAYEGEEAIGSGGVCYEEELPSPDNPSGICAYLMNLYVKKEARGKGVGSTLFDKMVEEAKKKGAGKIYLESTPIGRPIYYRKGFVDFPYLLRLPKEEG